jgi:hypothetical protein
MASDISLADFANRPRNGRGWVDDLPDDVFNQVWDGRHVAHVGAEKTAAWLRSLGYNDATASKVETILVRERRP